MTDTASSDFDLHPTIDPSLSEATTLGGGFVHLHLHSQYSLLDGGNRLDRLVERVKKLGMDAVAVTDHGNLHGAADFYSKAKAAGIKPILGIEAYVAPEVNGVSDRTSREYTGVQDGGHHLVLLAENQTGWQNLLKLSSDAYLKGFYFKPRMDKATLARWADGLIAINGHLGSSLAFHLLQHVRSRQPGQTRESCPHWKAAIKEAKWHNETFKPSAGGEPGFFVELQRHDTPEQLDINPSLIRLAEQLDLPLVADNDAHFLKRDDYEAHDVLCCISMGKTRDDVNRLKYPKGVYVKSPEEMDEAFGLVQGDSSPAGYGGPDCEVPTDKAREALDNTRKIADRCNVELDFNANHAPVVKVAYTGVDGSGSDLPIESEPALGMIDAFQCQHTVGSAAWYQAFCNQFELQPFDSINDADVSADNLKHRCDGTLRLLAEAGAVWRYGRDGLDASTAVGKERRERLERELKVLKDKDISAYFLIVWDFVNEARRLGIPVNARGSGVGTMVGYCLALSNACPIEYGLLFERFTDPDRSEYPDIDIDMCQDGRQSLIDYVRDKYGHVAQIITFNVLKARQAVRDVGRVLDVPLNEVNDVCKLIGDGLGTTIDQALEDEPDLRQLVESSPRYRQLIDMSRKLEGMTRHAGIHAAGVIVATQPLDNIVPLCKAGGSDAVVTQWDGPTCEKVGLLKMDFLGLRTLSIITRARELIQETLSSKVIIDTVRAKDGADPLELERLTFDDPAVFGLFQRGETAGVFQFESGGMRNLLVAMRPDRLEDLIAANALYRPGPMDLIPDYNDRKHGRSQVPQINEHVDDITAETYGIMVYQEQVMQVLNRVGGIPLRAAYTIIKAISKKKEDKIEAARVEFVEGAGNNGVSEKQAHELFNLIVKFAGYGFNKSHSTGYAIVAYQTAYLKTYFPVQYMAAVLTYESVSTDKVKQYMDECQHVRRPDGADYVGGRGVEVKPPDINVSGLGFTPVFTEAEVVDAQAAATGGHIRFGLSAVKGVGTSAIEAIIREREERGLFRSLFDFCERIPQGSVNRATVEALIKCGAFDDVHGPHNRAAMCEALEAAMRSGAQAAKLTQSDDFLFGAVAEQQREAAVANTHIGDEQTLPDVPAWSQQETLDFEMEVLGQYVSSHPLDDHRDTIETYRTCTVEQVKQLSDEVPVTLGAMIKSVRTVVTKKGDKMAIVGLEDSTGSIEAVMFPKTYAMHHGSLEGPNEDGKGAIILFVIGKCDRKRGEPQVIVDRLVGVTEAPRSLTENLTIVINDQKAPDEGSSFNGELTQLKQVLQQAGRDRDARTSVLLELRQAGQAVTMRLNNRVAISESLIGHIKTILSGPQQGHVSVKLAGPPKLFQSNGVPGSGATDPTKLHDGSVDRMRSAPVSRVQEHMDGESCASIDRY